MLAGEEGPEREWMLEAEKLVDMFRETRNLFLTSRVCTRLIIRTVKSLLNISTGKPVPWNVSQKSNEKTSKYGDR